MNKLITTELGGHPLTLNDLAFIQDTYSEAITGVLLGLSEPTNRGYILSGCELTFNAGTNSWWISQGYAVIKLYITAEIFYVPEHNTGLTTLGSDPYWAVMETNAPPSPVTYKNLNVKNVHKQRRLTVSVTPQTLLFPALRETPQLINVTKNRIWGQRVQFNHMNSWVPGVNPVPNGSYSVEGKRVFMCGDIRYSGSSRPTINQPFTVLPPELRPAANHMFTCLVSAGWEASANYTTMLGFSSNVPKQTWVRIQTDGNCYADPVNIGFNYTSPNASIVLDGVSWLLP